MFLDDTENSILPRIVRKSGMKSDKIAAMRCIKTWEHTKSVRIWLEKV